LSRVACLRETERRIQRNQMRNYDSCTSPVQVALADVIVHELYVVGANANDIALVFLASESCAKQGRGSLPDDGALRTCGH
jgi:hypothetical protein